MSNIEEYIKDIEDLKKQNEYELTINKNQDNEIDKLKKEIEQLKSRYSKLYRMLNDKIDKLCQGGAITLPNIKVIDNLLSNSSIDALSANQGRLIKQMIDQLNNDIDLLEQSVGTGLTSEQLNQLQIAYNHSQSSHVTESYVTNAINNAQLGGGEGTSVDLSIYATKDEINNIINNVLGVGDLIG